MLTWRRNLNMEILMCITRGLIWAMLICFYMAIRLAVFAVRRDSKFTNDMEI